MLNRLDDVAKAVSARITGKKDLGTPHFADKRYAPEPFSRESFTRVFPASGSRKICSPRSQLFGTQGSQKLFDHSRNDCGQSPQIAFIDAGNMEIFASPGLSVHFIRAYFSVFQSNKRIKPNIPQRLEFFSVSSASENRGDMQFSCSLIPAGESARKLTSEMGGIILSSSDPTISQAGGFCASVSVMGGVARKFAEWLYAAKIIESELGAGDILVKDGALITSVNGEENFAKKAYDAAEKQGAILCACAKTSDLLTTFGMPLTAAVQVLAEKNNIGAPWFYSRIAKNGNPEHRAEIFVANFHEKSRRAFRFEIERSRAESMTTEEKMDVFGAIALNSCDGPFLGYPYGLIDADANARISMAERANYRMVLLSMLARHGAGDFAELVEGAKDAHDVLNGMADKI